MRRRQHVSFASKARQNPDRLAQDFVDKRLLSLPHDGVTAARDPVRSEIGIDRGFAT